MSERAKIAERVLLVLIAAKPESVDNPMIMGELIKKAFKIADDLGAGGETK